MAQQSGLVSGLIVHVHLQRCCHCHLQHRACAWPHTPSRQNNRATVHWLTRLGNAFRCFHSKLRFSAAAGLAACPSLLSASHAGQSTRQHVSKNERQCDRQHGCAQSSAGSVESLTRNRSGPAKCSSRGASGHPAVDRRCIRLHTFRGECVTVCVHTCCAGE